MPNAPHPPGCIGREETSEAVRQAVGGGCRSGWGRLLPVTNAIEAGTWRPGQRPGGGAYLLPFQYISASHPPLICGLEDAAVPPVAAQPVPRPAHRLLAQNAPLPTVPEEQLYVFFKGFPMTIEHVRSLQAVGVPLHVVACVNSPVPLVVPTEEREDPGKAGKGKGGKDAKKDKGTGCRMGGGMCGAAGWGNGVGGRDVLARPCTVGGTPPLDSPPLPFRCLRLATKIVLRRLRCQEDLSFKMFGPPSAGAIGRPWEEGGSQPHTPPTPPLSNTSLGGGGGGGGGQQLWTAARQLPPVTPSQAQCLLWPAMHSFALWSPFQTFWARLRRGP